MDISPKQEQTLYDAVGGDPFFHRLVHGFYSQVKEDDLIGPMYPEQDFEGAENRLRWFLVQYWGGPREYQEKRGNPMLRRRHFPFPIGEPEAERWLTLMGNSMAQFTDDEGNVRPLTAADIMVITPYNAQVAELRDRLPDVHIGTVDKFQGQEAPRVFYSMATSSGSEAPRGMEFL